MRPSLLARLAFVALVAVVSTCSWTLGERPRAKVPDPNRCGAAGIPCGDESDKLCCDGKTQVCCPGVVKRYCAQSCS
jgi:hypothetical protein